MYSALCDAFKFVPCQTFREGGEGTSSWFLFYVYIEQIELPAKLLNDFLRSNKSNINQFSTKINHLRVYCFENSQGLNSLQGSSMINDEYSEDGTSSQEPPALLPSCRCLIDPDCLTSISHQYAGRPEYFSLAYQKFCYLFKC